MGGLEKLVRITRFNRDSTRAASSAFEATIENAPTRSPYNENDLENELAIKQTIPAAANLRTARVRLNARAKTLIGNIDKRDEFTLPDHLHNALPLRIA